METKETILKRLLEEKQITIDELFILLEKELTVVKSIEYVPIAYPQYPQPLLPYTPIPSPYPQFPFNPIYCTSNVANENLKK